MAAAPAPVLLFAEHEGGRPADETLALAAMAREAAGLLRRVVAVGAGPAAAALAGPLGAYGADSLLACEDERLGGYAPEAAVHLLAAAVTREAPAAVLFADTSAGRDLAARLAATLGEGLAPRCVRVAVEDAGLRAICTTHHGRLQAEVTGARVATVRAGDGPPPPPSRPGQAAAVERLTLELPVEAVRVRVREVHRADPRTVPLERAPFVVAGGGGLSDFALLWELGDRLGAAVGGSRVACDEGRLPRERQVGESGTTVASRCYIAFGISGASQHLRGIEDSRLIVAVNTDRHAPLMKLASMAVVGDAAAVLRAMLAELGVPAGAER